MGVPEGGEHRPGLGETLPWPPTCPSDFFSPGIWHCVLRVGFTNSFYSGMAPKTSHPDSQDGDTSRRIRVHYTMLGLDCIPLKFICLAPNP